MKIFVINLKNSSNRRQLMDRQLRELGLEFEFVEAIEGQAMSREEQAELCDLSALESHPDWLTPGAVGCALSHRLAWSRIANEGLKSALVMEDDLLLPDQLPAILTQLEQLYDGDELIMLYWLSNVVQAFDRQSAIDINGQSQLAVTTNPHSLLSSVMYLIGSEVAARMVSLNQPVRVTADHWACHFDGQAFRQIRCLVPSPIKLANYPSDIRYGKQNLLRRIKRRLEIRFWIVRQLSVMRREGYFAQRQRHHWV